MPQAVVPMIHVPDVRAAADWYQTIGFTLLETVEDDGVPNWADLSFGNDRIMLSAAASQTTGSGATWTSTCTWTTSRSCTEG